MGGGRVGETVPVSCIDIDIGFGVLASQRRAGLALAVHNF
jgi:hypothetical protein